MSSETLDWDDQRTFLAVLNRGSLSGAARSLGVAQPTVRNRIEALERALGTALFTRSVKGLIPTEQARALGVHARAMALASDAFVRAASAPSSEVSGTVRISVPEFVGVEVLPTMLRQLRDCHPALAIEVELNNRLSDMVGQEADIAVRMHRPAQQALVAKHVGAIPLRFFAHRDYLAERGSPTTIAELADHDLIGPDRTMSDFALAEALHPALSRSAFAIRTDSHPAQLAAVRAGLGIGIIQQPIGGVDCNLRLVLPQIVVHHLDTWIVMHEDLRQVSRVRTTFDQLAAQFMGYCVNG